MSAYESTAIDRILRLHEEELIEEALGGLPTFVLERRPRVMFDNSGQALARWLMFGHPPRVEWLELSSVPYDVLMERFPGDGTA